MRTMPLVFRLALATLLAGALLDVPAASAAATTAGGANARRSTLAVTYDEGASTTLDMIGAGPRPDVLGSADVKRKDGRTRIKLHMDKLSHPQARGAFYTTYVLWAIGPEGQAASLAELPHSKSFDMEVTTAFPSFGLIVTAEPHSAVALPSLRAIAENALRKDTVGRFQTGRLEYAGAAEAAYEVGRGRADYATPLLILGARNAVELAREVGAMQHANAELQRALTQLEMLERAWPRKRESLPKHLEASAREVMRLAENARQLAAERSDAARLADERNASRARLARAEGEADRARDDAERARDDADRAQARAAREQLRAAEAQTDAERAKAAEQDARIGKELALAQADASRQETERARLEADQARRDKADMQQQLFQSLSAILETRREARGLIVNMSDVLFDFDRASLTPGAREKLARLAGVLVAYPGRYHLTTEGHTDAVGSSEYNMTLSRDRAESVRSYLLASGVPPDRVGPSVGLGKSQPVASNDSAAGRQLNRRVEIVIADLD